MAMFPPGEITQRSASRHRLTAPLLSVWCAENRRNVRAMNPVPHSTSSVRSRQRPGNGHPEMERRRAQNSELGEQLRRQGCFVGDIYVCRRKSGLTFNLRQLFGTAVHDRNIIVPGVREQPSYREGDLSRCNDNDAIHFIPAAIPTAPRGR